MIIKQPPFTDSLLRTLSALVPQMRIELASSILIRGNTAKGRYEIRLWDEGRELRTSFVGRGRNPLKQRKILLRTPLGGEETLQAHAVAIRENERELPWIERERDPVLGDDIVNVKPFGDDPNGPVVVVRTSSRTGFISLTVEHAREMSPAEARLVAKALEKAAIIAAAKDSPAPAAEAV